MLDTFTYSVDMVRLKTDVKKYNFKAIMDKLNYNPYVKYLEKSQIHGYRHNFYISGTLQSDKDFVNIDFDEYGNMYQKDKEESYSFWIGAGHNARPTERDVIDVVIQYNPNKCKDSELLTYILDNIFLNNANTNIRSIDLAIDIPKNILDVKLLRPLNCSLRTFDNSNDDITYYLRKRGSNGHLKLYNKTRENKLDYDLTRYEITLKLDIDLRFVEMYQVDYGLFPDLLIMNDKQMDLEGSSIDGTEKVLTWACIDNINYLKMLPYRRRKKIEGYMETLVEKISFDNCKKIDNTIYDYFNTLKSKMDIKK